MAKFYGAIGFGAMSEAAPGVYEETLTEKAYFGDVIRNSRRLREEGQVHDDILVQNSISIVADDYANDNINNMRYIRWKGILWKVAEVTVERPRLIIRLGGVYNGPKDGTPVAV